MTVIDAQEVCSAAAAAVGYRIVGNSGSEEERRKAATPERAAQAALLRELFSESLRPHPFSPEWRTSTVVALAQGIYDERAFDRLPLLLDALMDAGCDNEEILKHCRAERQVHVLGCWVVDAVLGRS
jgi:hypothetical protein